MTDIATATQHMSLKQLQEAGLDALKNGKLDFAEVVLQKCVDGRKKKLGIGHPETLQVIDSLGQCYEMKKRFSEAEEKYLYAYKGRKKIFGDAHETTCQSLMNIANLYRKLSRWKQASDTYQVAFNAQCKLYGEQNIITRQTKKLLDESNKNMSSVCVLS